MFHEPHGEYKIVGMDGSGEIFSSELYRELFETERIFTDTHLWPSLNFSLSTNGTMMTEKIQQKYKNFFDHIGYLEISVDAGNEDSYNKVRVGGHWELLWKNIEYLYNNRSRDFGWAWNIIVQKNNYESIPELIDLANKFTNLRPKINFATLLNWGTWSEGEYINNAVHMPSHPEHQKYLAIMNSQLVKDYRELVK
jgi:sulfatase maturation enzyme AslB (radical SAM superfamily)